MSEKRFFTKINKKGRNVIIDKECHIEIIDLTMVCDVLNRLDLKLKHYNEVNGEQQATIRKLQDICGESDSENAKLRIENEQLRKQIQNYEQLISNSYVGEEETLDGFVGKYVIWENELQKYKEKIKGVFNE